MGTHPIFESDFDCLTENKKKFENRKSRIKSNSKVERESRKSSRKSNPFFGEEKSSENGEFWFDWPDNGRINHPKRWTNMVWTA